MPATEPTRVRIQIYDNDIGNIVNSLSSKYRSAFVEMAVVTWLTGKENEPAANIISTCDRAPSPSGQKIGRVRLQFFDDFAGQIIQGLASKYRPALISMAINAWLKTKEGQGAVKTFLVRGQKAAKANVIIGKIKSQKENPEPPAVPEIKAPEPVETASDNQSNRAETAAPADAPEATEELDKETLARLDIIFTDAMIFDS